MLWAKRSLLTVVVPFDAFVSVVSPPFRPLMSELAPNTDINEGIEASSDRELVCDGILGVRGSVSEDRRHAGFARRNCAIAGLSRACPARSSRSNRYSEIAMEV